jgi:hypothetical protein
MPCGVLPFHGLLSPDEACSKVGNVHRIAETCFANPANALANDEHVAGIFPESRCEWEVSGVVKWENTTQSLKKSMFVPGCACALQGRDAFRCICTRCLPAAYSL